MWEGRPLQTQQETQSLSEEEIDRRAKLLFGPDDEILLEWTVHLLTSRRDTTTRLIIALIVVFSVGYIWDGLIWVPLALIIVALAAAPYIFPTTYVLTSEGVHLINLIARDRNRWSRFKSYQVYPDAVQLLFARTSIRGWLLRGNLLFIDDADMKQQVVEIVSRYLQEDNIDDTEG